MKKALVIGHTGQDGYYLTQFLNTLSYQIVGVSSTEIYRNFDISLPEKFDLYNNEILKTFLNKINPDEIYYLAAYHQSSTDQKVNDGWLFQKSFDTNTRAYINILQWITETKLNCKIFYAASSHVFGAPNHSPQTEETPLNPNNIYGISKVASMHASSYYSTTHHIFASCGILYNHESPRRGEKFVTQKIIKTAIAIKNGQADSLELGDLTASIDWGFAPDYVKAFHAILQLEKPDNYIIATNQTHTVKDFVDITFAFLGLEPSKYVKQKEGIITKNLNNKLCGNFAKLNKDTGWEPTTTFEEMIRIMISGN